MAEKKLEKQIQVVVTTENYNLLERVAKKQNMTLETLTSFLVDKIIEDNRKELEA